MNRIRILAALAAICAATASMSAASLQVRETGSSTSHPLKSKASSTDWGFIHSRTLAIAAGLSPAEIEKGAATLEVYYYAPSLPGREVQVKHAQPLKAVASISESVGVSYTGYKSWGQAASWAARIVIDGKVVATSAENNKALEWIKALPVEGAAKP